MEVQVNALEEVPEVENAITVPLENFDLVVQAFDKAAVLSMNELVRNFFPPIP